MEASIHHVESYIGHITNWLRLIVETIGVLVIAAGVVVIAYSAVQALVGRHPLSFNATRLTFARYLALALEFQLASDILSTAIAPSWKEIGQLAAVAVIRTGLNYFLMHEMKEERAQADDGETEKAQPKE